MATIRELVVKFTLKADTKAVKRFKEALDGAKAAAMDLAAWGAKLATAYVAVAGALAANSAAAANFAEEVMRSASAFGITTAKFQEQLFAMQALGASADDLADMYSTLAERSIQAVEGSKTYTREFKRMGISLADLKGKKPGELFDLYIQRAGEMTDESQRAAAAAALLGDDLGRRVARGLGVAGSSFKDYVRIVNAVGGVFSEQQLEAAQKAQIQFRLLGATFTTLRRKIGLELAPVFGAFAEKMVRLISQNTDKINEFVVRLKDGVQRELGRLELVAGAVDQAVQRYFGGWINLADKLTIALGGVVATITGFKIASVISALVPLFTALSAPIIVAGAKVLALAVAIGILLLAFEDMWVEINGGNSFIGTLIERFEKLGPVGRFVAGILEFTIANFRLLSDQVSALAGELDSWFIPLLKFLGNVLVAIVGGAFIGLVNTILFVSNAVVWLVRLINGMIDAFIWLAEIVGGAVVNAFDAVGSAIAEGLGSIPELISQIGGMLPGFDVAVNPATGGRSGGVRDKLLSSNLAQPNAFATAATAGGGTRGTAAATSGGSTFSQKNEIKAEIHANSAAEGREAARGFKKEVESGGTFDSLRSSFAPGEI